MKKTTITLAAGAAAFCLAASSPATPVLASAQKSYTADYSVTLLGMPVARARFTTTIAPDGGFAMSGSLNSSGIARLFSSTSGSSSVSGRLGADGARPSAFNATYDTRRGREAVAVRFSGGGVTATEHQPAPRPRPSDWVPVRDQHLASVVDPLSATLVRAERPEQVCGRTLSVFDGWLRADVRLETVSTGPLPGREGTGVVCSGRFTPVAGYRSGSRDMNYLRDRGNIRISFAPLGDSGVYAPVEASVGTRVGTIHIAAGPIRAE